MTQRTQHFLDAIFLSIGSATGITAFLQDVDLWLGIILKGVSIFSFVLVIAINWEKGKEQFKKWFK